MCKNISLFASFFLLIRINHASILCNDIIISHRSLVEDR